MTPVTKRYIWFLRFLSLVYLVACILFFFFPEETFYLINVGPKVFKAYEEIPLPSERFWCVFAASHMGAMFVLCWCLSFHPQLKSLTLVHFVAKLIPITGFSYLFLQQNRYFAYIFGAAIETLILLVTFLCFFSSVVSHKKSIPTS